MKVIRLHKLLCPVWKWHVYRLWNLKPFKTYWFCRWCSLAQASSIGRSYRITLGEDV